MEAAALIITVGRYWIYAGLAVAAAFLLAGLDRVEPNARGAYRFRVLILPGLVLLWPLVLWRWWVVATDRDPWPRRYRPPRTAHGWVWSVLSAAIPAIFLIALVFAEPAQSPLSPVRLPEPESSR